MNPLANYKRTRIMTASPGELLVMLYDGLLQRVRASGRCAETGDFARAGELLGRAQDILHELMNMLDREKAPELADNLMGLYSYCSQQLLRAVMSDTTEHTDEVYELLKPLRDAWAEANTSLKNNPELRKVAVG